MDTNDLMAMADEISDRIDAGNLPPTDANGFYIMDGAAASVAETVKGTAYVVCDRLLDAETNEHCEYDGRRPIVDRRWTCPGCGARNY